MEIVLVGWIFFGIITTLVATNKGRNGCGWFLIGVLLGPLGFIISLVMPKINGVNKNYNSQSSYTKKCPYCAELIKYEAIVCRYCGRDLVVQPKESDKLTEDEINKYINYYKKIPNTTILELLEINKDKPIYYIIEQEALKRNLLENESK